MDERREMLANACERGREREREGERETERESKWEERLRVGGRAR